MKLFRTLLVASSVLALSATALPAQAGKVTCKDGTKSDGGRGACSGHGGIMTAATKATAKIEAKDTKAAKKAEAKAEKVADAKMTKAEKKAEKAEKKEEKKDAKRSATAEKNDDHDAKGAIAECKDHTYSHAKSRQGACSSHGGVAKVLKGN